MTDAADRPRILLITDRAPDFGSGYGLRVKNVMAGLCMAGALHVLLIDSSVDGVTLFPSANYVAMTIRAQEQPRWHKLLELIVGIPTIRYRDHDQVRRSMTAAVGTEHWDVVWCSRARTHLLAHGLLDGPRIVDLDDLNDRLELTKRKDRLHIHGWIRTIPKNLVGIVLIHRWKRLQRRIAAEATHVVVCSELDRAHLDVPNAAIVPNGYPDPGTGEPVIGSPPSILFVGPLTYEPNRLAVEWFVREVFPQLHRRYPDVGFDVVGDIGRPPRSVVDMPGVVLHGRVPDVAPYYDRATVAVTPLHSGGGTRIKVIEALARCVPLVSTSFACEGLGLTVGRELMVADAADDFLAACEELLVDEDRRAQLVAAGRARFESSMTSDQAADEVATLAATTLAAPSLASRDKVR